MDHGSASAMKKLPLFSLALLWAGVLLVEDSRAYDDNPFNLSKNVLARFHLSKGSLSINERAVAYSPNGRWLAVASSMGIWLYDAHTGAEVALLEVDANAVYSVSFSPDGWTLASSDDYGKVRLWDVSSCEQKATFEGHEGSVYSVSFSPDGSTLASGGQDGTVRLWDVSSGRLQALLEGDIWSVYSVSFSPDGSTLANGGRDGKVRLWDVSSGRLQALLEVDMDGVSSVSFSPDGSTLASGGWDGTGAIVGCVQRSRIRHA